MINDYLDAKLCKERSIKEHKEKADAIYIFKEQLRAYNENVLMSIFFDIFTDIEIEKKKLASQKQNLLVLLRKMNLQLANEIIILDSSRRKF